MRIHTRLSLARDSRQLGKRRICSSERTGTFAAGSKPSARSSPLLAASSTSAPQSRGAPAKEQSRAVQVGRSVWRGDSTEQGQHHEEGMAARRAARSTCRRGQNGGRGGGRPARLGAGTGSSRAAPWGTRPRSPPPGPTEHPPSSELRPGKAPELPAPPSPPRLAAYLRLCPGRREPRAALGARSRGTGAAPGGEVGPGLAALRRSPAGARAGWWRNKNLAAHGSGLWCSVLPPLKARTPLASSAARCGGN